MKGSAPSATGKSGLATVPHARSIGNQPNATLETRVMRMSVMNKFVAVNSDTICKIAMVAYLDHALAPA